MALRDIVYLSFRSVRSNRLRTILTVIIIALGIMALVGIYTTIESIRSTVYDNFSRMGANGFTIQSWQMNIHIGGHKVEKGNKNEKKVKTSRRNQQITYLDAIAFRDRFTFPATVSLSVNGGWMSTLFHADR